MRVDWFTCVDVKGATRRVSDLKTVGDKDPFLIGLTGILISLKVGIFLLFRLPVIITELPTDPVFNDVKMCIRRDQCLDKSKQLLCWIMFIRDCINH